MRYEIFENVAVVRGHICATPSPEVYDVWGLFWFWKHFWFPFVAQNRLLLKLPFSRINRVVVLMIFVTNTSLRISSHHWSSSMLWIRTLACYQDGSVWIIYSLMPIKRTLLLLGSHCMNMNFILMIRGLRQDSLKLLGVVLDSKLAFRRIAEKSMKKPLSLRRLSNFLSSLPGVCFPSFGVLKPFISGYR